MADLTGARHQRDFRPHPHRRHPHDLITPGSTRRWFIAARSDHRAQLMMGSCPFARRPVSPGPSDPSFDARGRSLDRTSRYLARRSRLDAGAPPPGAGCASTLAHRIMLGEMRQAPHALLAWTAPARMPRAASHKTRLTRTGLQASRHCSASSAIFATFTERSCSRRRAAIVDPLGLRRLPRHDRRPPLERGAGWRRLR